MTQTIPIGRTEPSRRALRLVNTRHLERSDWLEVRKPGIGGSDAAAAVGLCPYKSQLELWLEKTGRDSTLEKPDSTDTTQPVYWGTVLEPIVAGAYARKTGRKLRRVHAVLQHPQHPFMLANLDREIIGAPGVQILECKTAGEHGARHWRDGVPDYVQLQVQHQLAVSGRQAADVAVLICGQQLDIHRVERDDELIARLITLESRFWEYVTRDTPPPADGSESADRALRCLYPGNGSTVNWSDDRTMSTAFANLVELRAGIKAKENDAERLRQYLQQAMGDATEAVFETGRVTFRRAKDSVGVDVERLRTDYPQLAERYSTIKPGSRRFRICD